MIQILMKCDKCPSAKIVNPKKDLWTALNNVCGLSVPSNVFNIEDPPKAKRWHFIESERVLLCHDCACAAVETRNELTRERDEKLAEFVGSKATQE